MARIVVNYTVTGQGRDHGKVFVLTEMSSSKGEAWATKALLALMASNPEIPAGFEKMGMAGMAELGLRALTGLSYGVLEPLMAEMFECVTFMPDPSKTHIIRNLIEDDIEEVVTRLKLRAAIWDLHTPFLKAVAPSIFANWAAAAESNTPTT